MNYIIKFFVCGVLTALLFPPFFILPLGFISFPYLFFLIIDSKIINSNKLEQFIYGTFFGLGLNLILLIWIKEPFLINPLTEKFSLLSYFVTIYVAIYFGLAFIILGFFKNEFSKLIMIPVVFVITEVLRENFLYGFPWVTFALLTSSNYFFIQIAYYVSTYGLSYLIISIFLIPTCIVLLIKNKSFFPLKIYLTIIIVIILVLSTLIIMRLNFSKDVLKNNGINISLNQLNINQKDKFNNLTTNKRFAEITETIQKGGNYLFIFSETDYPYLIKNNNIVNVFQNILINNQALIIGGIRKDSNKFYNSMYFINKDSFQIFDKKILVPFGEFLPFRNNLTFLEEIVGSTDFSVGNTERYIRLDENFNFIPVICYEIIFFNDLLEKVNNQSPLMINITNDAWFGQYSGPYQHFYLSRIRSVEFNKYLIRVSNNGISSIINNYGKIIKFLPLNSKGQLKTEINIPTNLNNLVKYHRLIYLIIFFVLIFAILIERKFEKFNSKI